jgi:hypothetical protein
MSEESTRVQADTLADITAFDAVSENEVGVEVELMHQDGATGTGVFVTVIGQHADVCVKFTNQEENRKNREAVMAMRRNKPIPVQTLEEIRERSIQGAVIRVTGWRNVKQAFDPELLRQALKRNPHWVDQIYTVSNDVGNFTKAQQPN